MKNFLYGFLLQIFVSPATHAYQASEILHIDRSTPQTFLLSNAVHENLVEVKNSLEKQKAFIRCDGTVKLKKRSGKELSFTLKKKVNLFFSQDVGSCELKVGDKTIKLLKDESAFLFLKRFNAASESCRYEVAGTGTDQTFLSNNYPMMTCAHKAQEVEILEASEDGLLSKMEALLGYKPSVDFIRAQNPYAELDLSRAPKLDAIFVSTLLYRHDFVGTVIARLLRFHAERGTLVNIIGTGYMHEEKDKALLKELALATPNIRIQEYKYVDAHSGPKGLMTYVDHYLRDMHVKMFVTLSSSHPENNVLIMGGRNIHDGFVFSDKPDLSNYPELDQAPEGDYAYWNDLEIKITSKELAESVYGHLLRLWNREVKGQKVQDILKPSPTKINGEEILSSDVPMMRHFLSLPFNDERVLEKLFVEMIDKAQKSIKLSSPYLRPTKAIMDAFERAIQRKVEVTIQTRIDLKGDTQAWLYEETNKAAINSLFDKVRIYEWTENSILHTKMLLIDDKFAFFGSVNLSRRSFIQDVENGFLIHHEGFVQKLTQVFDGYNARSRVIETKQKRKFFASIVVQLLQDQF